MIQSDLMNAYEDSEHFHHSTKFSCPLPVNPFPPKQQPLIYFWYLRLLMLILECLINGIIHYVLFCVCLFTQLMCKIHPYYTYQ